MGREVVRDLSWVAGVLEDSDGLVMMDSLEWPLADAEMTIYGDALMMGMGFWCADTGEAFCADLPHESPLRTIYYFEALTAASSLAWAAGLPHPPKRLVIYSDSLNTVDTFSSFKAGEGYNDLVLFAARILILSKISLCVVHIPGVKNVVADALSRGLFRQAQELIPGLQLSVFQPPSEAMGQQE